MTFVIGKPRVIPQRHILEWACGVKGQEQNGYVLVDGKSDITKRMHEVAQIKNRHEGSVERLKAAYKRGELVVGEIGYYRNPLIEGGEGQHTLKFIMDEGIKLLCSIRVGVDPASRDGKDRIKVKKLENKLFGNYRDTKKYSVGFCKALAGAILAGYNRLEIDQYDGQAGADPLVGFGEYCAWEEKHPKLHKAVERYLELRKAAYGKMPWMIAFAFEMYWMGLREGDKFWTAVATGAMLKKGDPALALRNRLIGIQFAKKKANQHANNRRALVSLARQAEVAYLTGQSISEDDLEYVATDRIPPLP